MKNAKRWLAILLAVTLLCSNGIYQLGTTLSANETETTEEAQPEENSETVAGQTDGAIEDTGKATVQEVTPEEESGDSSAQDAETANVPEAAAQEDVQEGQNEATVQEPAAEAPAAEAPAAEGAGQAEEAAAPEVQTYNVKINKSELDGGQIKVWGSDNTQVDVTEYDGNNQYVKEVKEGEEFNFQITLKDGFDGAQVKVNNNDLAPESTDGNVITYKVAGINEEKVIDVTYNKVETPAEEEVEAEKPKAEDEVKAEEPKAEDEVKAEEPEDNSVNTASLNENVSTVADTDINRTVRVGQTITLDSSDKEKSYYNYTHEWTVNDNTIVRLNTTSGTSITVTGLKAGKASVTDNYTWVNWLGILQSDKKTYTITVRSAVTPTNITIEGSDKVTQFQTMQLTAKLTPADADGTVTWSSSNEQILSVDNNGLVTGKRQGEATVTASVQGTAISTTKSITVEQDTTTEGTEATVFFLLDPTKNPNSNDQSEWGAAYGTAVVNLKNAIWVDDKNCFEDVDQRVISWPNGTNVIPRNSDAWEQIFNNYQATLKKQFGELKFSKDDVEEITLVPAKISKNNGTTSTSLATHLDCSVNIKCKNIALVKYYLFDAGGTGYVQQGAKNYIINDSAVTDPKSVTGKDFQTIKEVGGVTYTFSGWYTDQSLTNLAPEFPAKVTASVDYYAKYIAGYQVMYNLAGGKFSDGSTSATEKHNVDTMVVVKEQPTRAGYKFKGWKVEGLSGTTTINSGESFTMPNGNVTLTAQWEEQKIENFITLNTTDVEHVYDGTAYSAGIATVNGADSTDVKIEYSVDEQTWTTNPSDITATNVSDSKMVRVRATSEKYTGKLEKTEKLTITKRPITITGDGWPSDQAYTGNEYKKTTYTVEEANAENTRGLVAGQTAEVAYELKGTNVGNYTGIFETAVIKNAEEDVTANYTVTKTPGKLTITKAEIAQYVTLTPTDVKKTYDGNVYAAGTATASDTNGNDLKIEYQKADGSWTTNPSEITATNVSDSKIVNVRVSAGNYEGYVNGTEELTITARPITITGDGWASDQSYTGNEYKKITYTVEEANAENTRGLVAGQKVNTSYEIKGTNAGTYTGAFGEKFEIKTAGGAFGIGAEDVTANYTVTKTPGTLNIIKSAIENYINIYPVDVTEVYNGEAHAAGTATASDRNGNVLKIEYSVNGTDWTEDPSEITATNVSESTTVNVRVSTENYDGYVTGTEKLTITPATLTVSTPIATKVYEGTPLTAAGTISGFVNGETATFTTTGSQTEVGSTANTYSLTWDGTAKESNYTVAETIGTLTVTAQSIDPENPDYKGITVDAPTDVEYTGADQTWLPTVTDGNGKALVKDTDYTVTYDNEDRTNVTGIITVTINGAGNYAGTITRTYQITPKPVTITTESKTRAFDGTALTAGGKVEGIVSGETYGFKTTGSQTYVGSSQNTYEMVWADSEVEGTSGTYTAKSTNYTVIESIGILAITAGTPENPLDPTPTDPAAPTTPTTPAAPTTTPARPEARTTEPTGNAFIDNVVTPIVEKAEEKVAEIKEVFNSDDDDVPLADQKLDDNNDHKCCILHFLIMLITLLVYAFATKSMKKRQKKLHEVREELDCELAKRGLPLSTEKQ